MAFIPATSSPSEKAKTFIEDWYQVIKDNREDDLYKEVFNTKKTSKASSKSIWDCYRSLFNYLNQNTQEKVTTYASQLSLILKITESGGVDVNITAKLIVLNIIGLIDVEQNNEHNKRGRYKVSFSLGPNALALENNKTLTTFSKETVVRRKKPLVSNFLPRATRAITRQARESKITAAPIPQIENALLSEALSLTSDNLTMLFQITERIHADFKELERRLELRKPNNPKQYYHDMRLIEHLKGEFSPLMVQVLPEPDEDSLTSKLTELKNPGELLQLTDTLKAEI